MRQERLSERWRKRASYALAAGVAVGTLSACDSLLEVDLPHLLKDDAIKSVNTAELQVNSAIALFECGYSAFALTTLGHDDTMQSVAGVGSGNNVYGTAASTGACDGSDSSIAWFDQIMGARSMLSTDPARLTPTAKGTVTAAFPVGRGVYDRIRDEWTPAGVPANQGERLSAIAAIYVAMSIAHFGEFTCEAALDGSDMLTPDQMLAIAEDWITNRALVHIAANPAAAGGPSFVMPFGITGADGTANEMALAIRARIRWARRDFAGAATDAATVIGTRPRFTAWITRDVGATRRNKPWFTNTFQGYSGMMGLNRTWNGPTRQPNPATGQTWPAIIPFTGYIGLGLTPDGAALDANNIPIRFANEQRGLGDAQVPCNATSEQPGCPIGAVQDTRVTHVRRQVQTGFYEVPTRYGTLAAGSDGVDIPYMTWEELTLIRAEHANTTLNNQAAAIAFINAIRAAPNALQGPGTMAALPAISGAYLTSLTNGAVDGGQTDQQAVRAAILEERRREFFSEGGRYLSTKIQNTDLLWFPRRQGNGITYQYQGGVRYLFSADEYTINPYWVARGRENARGTGCSSLTAPGYTLTGSQVPIF